MVKPWFWMSNSSVPNFYDGTICCLDINQKGSLIGSSSRTKAMNYIYNFECMHIFENKNNFFYNDQNIYIKTYENNLHL